MDQWQGYSDATGGPQRRYNGNGQQEYNVSRQNSQLQHSPGALRYDQYGNVTHSSATSPLSTPQLRDNNGDIPMADAHDAYGSMKYPMRPHHQSHHSGGRPPAMNLPSEPSAAAQRYSPMEVLPPTSPYNSKSATGQFSPHRQSPTRANSNHDYSSSPYYGNSRQGSQLPTINPYGNNGQDSQPNSAVSPFDGATNDPKSPQRRTYPAEKKPVPEFKKIRAPNDLRPKVNAQPAFRRADPEGGFISVGSLLDGQECPITDVSEILASQSAHNATPLHLPNLQS
jgi:dual specificity protein kinase YAK1